MSSDSDPPFSGHPDKSLVVKVSSSSDSLPPPASNPPADENSESLSPPSLEVLRSSSSRKSSSDDWNIPVSVASVEKPAPDPSPPIPTSSSDDETPLPEAKEPLPEVKEPPTSPPPAPKTGPVRTSRSKPRTKQIQSQHGNPKKAPNRGAGQAPADQSNRLYFLRSEPAKMDVDRYGYERDPSQRPETEKDRALALAESAKEREREVKWAKMLGPEVDPDTGEPTDHFRRYRTKNVAKFERRVMKGIPDACRGRVWYEFLDSKRPGKSGRPRPTIQALFDRGVPESDHTIQVDIPRTMPQMTMFSRNDVRESLYRMLRAYSNIDSKLGYFQGMAFAAGLLRSYMDEEHAFWAFCNFMNGSRHMFRMFYLNEFSRLRELNQVWEALLKRRYSKIALHLKKLELEPMLYTPPWFLTGFQTLQFPPQFKLRLFDRQIVFGTRALLSFAITIVSVAKNRLQNGGAEECIPVLQSPVRYPEFYDWRRLIKKFDAHFVTREEYKAAFGWAGLKNVFP